MTDSAPVLEQERARFPLERIVGVVGDVDVRYSRRGGAYRAARCPVCEGERALSILEQDNGRVQFVCENHCSKLAILPALGLTSEDLQAPARQREAGDELRPDPDALPDPVCALRLPSPEPTVFIAKSLVIAGEISLIAGGGGAKKTTAAAHMAGAIAAGARAFDRFETLRGPVLIASAEDPATVIVNHIEAFAEGHGWGRERTLENVHVFPTIEASIADGRWQHHLTRAVEQLHAAFLLLDPLGDLLDDENENDNSDMRPVMRFLRRLAHRTGVTPCLVHHVIKAPTSERKKSDQIRGATAITNASRSTLFFEELDDGALVEQVKLSRAPKVKPFALKLTIESETTNGPWKRATMKFETAHTASLNRAENFVVAQVTASPRVLGSSELKRAAAGTGISGQEVSEAIATLEKRGRIAYADGPRKAKLWYSVSELHPAGRVEQTTLPTLPEPCPAGSFHPASDPAPLKGAGRVGAVSAPPGRVSEENE